MNPKLEDLKEQSYIQEVEYDIYRGHAPYYVNEFSEEKFAELIVKECLYILDHEAYGTRGEVSLAFNNLKDKIRSEFGINDEQ